MLPGTLGFGPWQAVEEEVRTKLLTDGWARQELRMLAVADIACGITFEASSSKDTFDATCATADTPVRFG